MQTYMLSPRAVRQQLRREFWRFQSYAALSLLAFGLFLAFNNPVRWEWAAPITAIIALAYFFIIFLNQRQQRRALQSLRIEVDGSRVTRRALWEAPLTISRADVTAVVETRAGLRLETVDQRICLLVPRGLIGPDPTGPYARLSTWATYRPMPPRTHLPGILRWAGLGGALLILLFAHSLWLILPLGIFFILAGIVTERRLEENITTEMRIARSYSMAFSFIIFTIVMKSCFLAFSLLLR